MFESCILKSGQMGPFVSFKAAAWFLLPLFCCFSQAATTTSSVVLISPVSVMTSIAGIAPVISTSGGWITIRLSVPQIKQLSGFAPAPREETTGNSRELPDGIEAEKPNLDSVEVQVSEEGSSLNVPSDFATLGIQGQPIVSLNLSKANTTLGAAGARSAINPEKPNGYKLTVGFN